MLPQRLLVCLGLSVSLLSASHAVGATIQRLSPPTGVGPVEFKHLKANASGDFIAVSDSRIYVGNAAHGPVDQLLASDTATFSLDNSAVVTVNNQQLRVDAELFDTRVDLNANGDFVVASNTYLWVGNTRAKTLRQVADAGSFTQFQAVRLNDAGQYVALGDAKILGGNVSAAQATVLLDSPDVTFSVLDVTATPTGGSITAGDQRLALNAKGQFVAISNGTVFVGDLTALTATQLYQERWVGFRHVALSDTGTFIIVATQDVFSGTL